MTADRPAPPGRRSAAPRRAADAAARRARRCSARCSPGAAPASAHAALTGSDPQAGRGGRQAPRAGRRSPSPRGRAVATTRIRVLDPDGKRVDTGTATADRRRGSATVRRRAARRAARRHVHRRLAGGLRGQPPGRRRLHLLHRRALQDHRRRCPSRTGRRRARRHAVRHRRGTSRTPGSSLLVGGCGLRPGLLAARRAASGRMQRLVVARLDRRSPPPPSRCCCCAAPYTGSGQLGDVFDLDGLRAGARRPGRAPRWCPGCCCSPPPRCSSPCCSGPYAEARGRARRSRTWPSGSPSAARSSPSGSPRPGRWPSTPRPGSSRASRCRSTYVHLLAVAAWLGGLAALLVALYRAPGIERAAVRRFSRIAFGSVLVLVATGHLPVLAAGRLVVARSTDRATGSCCCQDGLVVLLVGRGLDLAAVDGRLSGRPGPDAAATAATGRRARRAPVAAAAGAVRADRRRRDPGRECRAVAEAARPSDPRTGRANSPGSGPPWRPPAKKRCATPTRSGPGCAARCWPRRGRRGRCWPSPPC